MNWFLDKDKDKDKEKVLRDLFFVALITKGYTLVLFWI